MSRLPKGWQESIIDDITIPVEKINQKDNFDKEINYIEISSINSQTNTISMTKPMKLGEAPSRAKQIVKTGDILFSTVRPYLRNIADVSFEYDNEIASTGFSVLRPVSTIHSRFLYYYCISDKFVDGLTAIQYGISYPAVKNSQVLSQSIPIPPLNEQKRIAEKLDQIFTEINSAKVRFDKITTILKKFRQSVLQAAVTGQLTEYWRKRNQSNSMAKLVEEINEKKTGALKVRAKKGWQQKIEPFELPENWSWIENHKISKDLSNAICAGPFGTIFKAKNFKEEGIPIVFLRHIKDSRFNQNDPKYMDKKVWQKFHQDYSVFGGELLVAKLGDPPGESCIYPEDMGVSMITPDVMKMNVDERLAETKYLQYYFNSPINKKLIGNLAFGATRLRIDIATFKMFPIPLPPRDEQREIVLQVESLFTLADKIEEKYEFSIEQVDKLKHSVLEKAFCGDLISQNQTDEPASILLKRIKVERIKVENTKKEKKKFEKTKKKGKGIKMILPVVKALSNSIEALSTQELLIAAGYPNNASIEEVETFFMDIRQALEKSEIERQRIDNEDFFKLTEKVII